MVDHLHPKCANPACPTAFRWMSGGRFYRFNEGQDQEAGAHRIKHFWLCERCSQLFMLAYLEGEGIVLRLRPELPEESFREAEKACAQTA